MSQQKSTDKTMFFPGRKWYVINTNEGAEKKVLQTLQRKNIVCYLPLLNIKRQHWDGNFSVSQVPLFPQMIFVNIAEAQVSLVRNADGVKNFLYWRSSYAIMNEEEIATIKYYVNRYEKIWLKKIEVNPYLATSNNSWASYKMDKVNKSILPSLGFEIYASEINITREIVTDYKPAGIPENIND